LQHRADGDRPVVEGDDRCWNREHEDAAADPENACDDTDDGDGEDAPSDE